MKSYQIDKYITIASCVLMCFAHGRTEPSWLATPQATSPSAVARASTLLPRAVDAQRQKNLQETTRKRPQQNFPTDHKWVDQPSQDGRVFVSLVCFLNSESFFSLPIIFDMLKTQCFWSRHSQENNDDSILI